MPKTGIVIHMGAVRLVGCSPLLLFILYPQNHHTYTYNNHDLYINQTRKSWEKASQSCVLVGSERASSYNVIVQNIPVLQLSRNTYRHGELYWIGATATFTPWLKLLGCYVYKPISTIRTYRYRYSVIGPVADCYLQCKSHFGVNESHCHCLPKAEQGQLNNKSCRLNASGQSDIVGTNVTTGYNGELYQIAIYRLTNDTLNINADTLDECLLNSTTYISTHPCDAIDSSNQKWTNAIINGLSFNDGNQSQWTRYIRRRIIWWNRGHVLDLNTSACVSVKQLSNQQEYEMVLRQCDAKLPYICLKGNDRHTHKMMTSSLETSPTLPSKRPENTKSSIGAQHTHQLMTTSLPTSPFLPQERPGNTRTSNGETGSISVIVGVVMGGAVLVLIIVAIVIIKLTRMSSRANSKPQPVSPPTENVVYGKLAAKYDERSSNHSPQNNESIATSSTIVKPTDSEKESGEMLLTTNDDVYNHTWDKPMKERQPDHVYSTTCSGSEYDYSQVPGINSDVYNHTWDKPITEQQTDHVYSTTGSGNDASLYDHTE
ncbi:uncharacterized protein [Magallana gigas]|uniref:uncharacterized protein isoform X1 n=1 Tax=Magallana gigas TaxID=29159 RepID=UPI00333FEC2F